MRTSELDRGSQRDVRPVMPKFGDPWRLTPSGWSTASRFSCRHWHPGGTVAQAELSLETDDARVTAPDNGSAAEGRARRLAWGVVDQGMSSLTNFLIVATVAHLLGAAQLGAYSIALVTYAVALNASRGLATDPLMVRHVGESGQVWRDAARRCTGTALAVGLASGVVVTGAALLLPQPTRGAILALGLTLPALLLQDSVRFVFFVAGQGGRAFVTDLVWAVALVPALLAVYLAGHGTASWFVLAWGASSAVAAVAGLSLASVLPRPLKAPDWLAAHRDLGFRYMVEGVAGSFATQLRAYGIGIALGLTALGYLQVVNTLMGPFMILFLGTGMVIIPELGRIVRRSPRRLVHACTLMALVLGGAALLWGAALWFALPRGLGQLLVGDLWRPARDLVLLGTLAIMGGCVSGAAGSGLHALGAARRSLRAMLISSVVYVGCGVGGALALGLTGALLGGALSAWTGAALFWRELRAAMRETGGWVSPPSAPPPAEVPAPAAGSAPYGREMPDPPPVVIAGLMREQGITGVHTHVRQLRRYLAAHDSPAALVTPHTWSDPPHRWRQLVLLPLFGVRPLLERAYGPAHVAWYRTSHEYFLYRALRRYLSTAGPCVVYAQCPVSASAALRARRRRDQRVVMAVHFRASQAVEWADKGQITSGGRTFRSIQSSEREVIPRLDGLVFVSEWARAALTDWLPEARTVPGTVVTNFVTKAEPGQPRETDADLVTVGNLDPIKNHGFLLRVLAAARSAGHTYTLDIWGQGAERSNLLRLAAELGLSDQVRLRGYRPEAREVLPRYRVYVHSSHSESSCLAIMEAMAAGRPVVSSTGGALTALFDDPQEGRFWPLDDPHRAAEILVDLMESEPERDVWALRPEPGSSDTSTPTRWRPA